MFGRRRQEEEAREAERRALFAELAKRPDTVCPFLGLADARAEYREGVSDDHRCYAFGDPAELSAEQQTKVCLQRGYGNCPRYLRGVLVIPTEELEALRRPQPAAAPEPPPPAAPRGGRRWGLILALVLLLAVGAGGAAFVLLGNGFGVAGQPSATPTVAGSVAASVAVTPQPTPSAAPSAPSPTLSESPTSVPETSSPGPTPTAGGVFVGYSIAVETGDYVIYQIDDAGTITDQLVAHFGAPSHATVAEVTAPNGLHYWRTLDDGFVGYCYIYKQSGPFVIREIYQASDGSLSYVPLPENRF